MMNPPDEHPPPFVRFSENPAGRHRIGTITLDNPRALNALDLETLRAMERHLLEWRQRQDIACVVLHAESAKAFCAGGDVKALVAGMRRSGIGFAVEYFAAEYFVDYLIQVYPKPILCWADGITMGGGIGIMNGASCRVVTERTVMAMPEIAIGLFPDVGATYFLNRLTPGLGLFLGLTGARFDGRDAVAIGMAEGFVRSDKKPAVFEKLTRLDWQYDPEINRQVLREHLASFVDSEAAAASELPKRLEIIRGLVGHGSIGEIDRAMRNWIGADEWIDGAIRAYRAGCPTSAAAVFAQLEGGKRLSVKEVFLREWDMALNFCARSDLREGVRARLIDKDHRPRWHPPALAEVESGEIARLFSNRHGQGEGLAKKFAALLPAT